MTRMFFERSIDVGGPWPQTAPLAGDRRVFRHAGDNLSTADRNADAAALRYGAAAPGRSMA